jgi:4-hydroxybenzoyl-CoA thioesterase
MASRTVEMPVDVRFGDCDPAGIVFFPNFHRWMDAASLHFFMACGMPPWHELEHTRGIVGTPLLEHQARFAKSVTFGERITISTHIQEWRAKVFLQKHVVTRGEDFICESVETRIFVARDPQDRRRLRSMAVPQDIKDMCGG